jgi:hypothetical protein
VGCSLDGNEQIECLRGDDPKPGFQILVAGPLFFLLVFCIIVVSMYLIIRKVRQTERRMEQYMGTQNQGYERTKEVSRQALLYIGAFLLTYVPIGGTMLFHTHVSAFIFALLTKTLSPMQGCFNAIIFLRNQYRALTAQGQSLYFLRRLKQGDAHPEEEESPHSTHPAVVVLPDPPKPVSETTATLPLSVSSSGQQHGATDCLNVSFDCDKLDEDTPFWRVKVMAPSSSVVSPSEQQHHQEE